MEIYSDGGSRGNPGPSACAFVVYEDGEIAHKDSKFLNIATNNFAEYQGVLLALSWVLLSENKSSGDPITFYMDSELVVKQINGIYKIKEPTLVKLVIEIKDLLKKIDREIIFKNIPREKNKIADQLVNQELDKPRSV